MFSQEDLGNLKSQIRELHKQKQHKPNSTPVYVAPFRFLKIPNDKDYSYYDPYLEPQAGDFYSLAVIIY